jgi:hypothetical protein
MVVSAVMVSLLMMSTAATMADIQERSYPTMDKNYHINSLQEVGQKLDLAKKSDRERFRETTNYVSSYTVDLNYWKENRCYNITLSNPSSETRLTCVGNGSTFHDAFEDGEYKDPAWIKNSQDGSVQVTNRYQPNGGTKALELTESGDQDSSYTITWQGTTSWNNAWKAQGIFYTEELDSSVAQKHSALLKFNQGTTVPIKVSLGFTDSSGNNRNFKILNQGPINNADSGTTVNWQENTWYNWEITHDGSGNYEGRIWEATTSRPQSPDAEASGTAPSDAGTAGFSMNGTGNTAFKVSHGYFKMNKK